MSKTQLERIKILGSFYSVATKSKVHDLVLAAAQAQQGSYICVSNVHTTMMGFWNKAYRTITNASFLSIPDGMPLVWAMKLLGAKVQDRVRGPTLMRNICDIGCKVQLKHYFFGSTPQTLQALEKRLRQEFPDMLIVGSESPPFRPLTDAENQQALERIRASGAEVVWVGLGAPKQEIWMYKNYFSQGPLMIGVGAAFDLLSGRIPEAPLWMQHSGMEWIFRLAKEPGRLWQRYFVHNLTFLFFFILQYIAYGLGLCGAGRQRE